MISVQKDCFVIAFVHLFVIFAAGVTQGCSKHLFTRVLPLDNIQPAFISLSEKLLNTILEIFRETNNSYTKTVMINMISFRETTTI